MRRPKSLLAPQASAGFNEPTPLPAWAAVRREPKAHVDVACTIDAGRLTVKLANGSRNGAGLL